MSDITIPPEALEAAAKILHAHAEIFDDVPWEDLSDADQEAYMDEARAACLAMLNAWPGMTWACRGKGTPPHLLFLPLPTENTND
jgi:hypothetical protein